MRHLPSFGGDGGHDDWGSRRRDRRAPDQDGFVEPRRTNCQIQSADQNRRGIRRACRLPRFERLPAHRGCPMSRPKIAALIIFDGWGLREAREANAILKARTPTMNRLTATQAHTEIDASGESVGLLPGVMATSEVGHLTIGAGRVTYQDVMRIA